MTAPRPLLQAYHQRVSHLENYLSEILQRYTRLHRIWRFDKEQFMFPNLAEDTLRVSFSLVSSGERNTNTHHIVPGRDDRLHVEITRKESNDPIGHSLAHVDQNTPKISHYSGVVPHFESRRDRYLIRTTRDDHWEESVSSKRHGV